MATPKKNVSKSRRNMRRFAGGNALAITQTTTCPACSETVRPHRICKCGNYAGKLILKARVRKSTTATA